MEQITNTLASPAVPPPDTTKVRPWYSETLVKFGTPLLFVALGVGIGLYLGRRKKV